MQLGVGTGAKFPPVAGVLDPPVHAFDFPVTRIDLDRRSPATEHSRSRPRAVEKSKGHCGGGDKGAVTSGAKKYATEEGRTEEEGRRFYARLGVI